MRDKRLLFSLAVLAIGGKAVFWFSNRPAISRIGAEVLESIHPSPSNAPSGPPIDSSSLELQQPGGPYVPSDPRWAIVREKDKAEPKWEWRMPINFYGRVLDENE